MWSRLQPLKSTILLGLTCLHYADDTIAETINHWINKLLRNPYHYTHPLSTIVYSCSYWELTKIQIYRYAKSLAPDQTSYSASTPDSSRLSNTIERICVSLNNKTDQISKQATIEQSKKCTHCQTLLLFGPLLWGQAIIKDGACLSTM